MATDSSGSALFTNNPFGFTRLKWVNPRGADLKRGVFDDTSVIIYFVFQYTVVGTH